MNKTVQSMPAVREVLLLLALGAVFLLPSLATRDVWNPDEPRYVEVAREMVVLDDYIVPHLNGVVYPDKPPLFFWLTALFYRMGAGIHAGRITAILASLGTVLVTYFLARRFLAFPGPLLAGIFLMTTGFFLYTSRMGVINPLLTLLTTSAIACGIRAMDREERRFRLWWLATYALVGLAILTKGPVGIMVVALVLAAYGFALHGNVRKGGWIHLAGVLLMLAVVAAWLVPALHRGGAEYSDNILFKQTADRAVKSYSHRRHPFYYLLLMPGILLPWTFFFIIGTIGAWRAWRGAKDPAAALGLSWFFPILIAFSLVSGKRTGYLLPLAPGAALLVARYFTDGFRSGFPWPRWHRGCVIGMLSLVLVGASAALAGPVVAPMIIRVALDNDPATAQAASAWAGHILPWWFAAMAAVIVIAIAGWRRARRSPTTFPITLLACLLILSVAADLLVLPMVNTFKSGKDFAVRVSPLMAQADQVFLYRKNFSGVYNLYTGRISMPVLDDPADLLAELGDKRPTAVVVQEADLIVGQVVLPERVHVEAQERVGHRNIQLLTNWPAQAP